MKRDLKRELFEDLKNSSKANNIQFTDPYSFYMDESYSKNPFFNNDGYLCAEILTSARLPEYIKNNPLFLIKINQGSISHSDLWKMLKANPYSIISMPSEDITEAMYCYAISKDHRLFAFLDTRFQTREIVFDVIKKEPLLLEFTHDDLLLYFICDKAVSLDYRSIQFVPSSIIDEPLILKANASDDAFLLNLLPNEFLTNEIFLKSLAVDKAKTSDFLIENFLIEHLVTSFEQAVINQHDLSPSYVLGRVKPSHLTQGFEYRKEALSLLFLKQPQWIDYLDYSCVTADMIISSVSQGYFPTLHESCWTSDAVHGAYQKDPRFITGLPKSRIYVLGDQRLLQTIITAIQQKWIEDVPYYAFNKSIIENPNLKDALIEHRTPFSYAINSNNKLNWEDFLEFYSSIDELLLISEKVPTEYIEKMCTHQIEFYVLLEDADKTLDLTVAFLKSYPDLFDYIPSHIKNDTNIYLELVNQVPELLENESDNINRIYKVLNPDGS